MASTFTGLKLQGQIGKFGAKEISDIEGQQKYIVKLELHVGQFSTVSKNQKGKFHKCGTEKNSEFLSRKFNLDLEFHIL